MTVDFDKLCKSIPYSRLKSYAISDNSTDSELLENYMDNIRVSMSLYPALSIFEVVLRNSVDSFMIDYTGMVNWWDCIELACSDIGKVNDAKKKVGISASEHGRVIAELTLGFWVSILSKKYGQLSFQSLLTKRLFANLPKGKRGIKHIRGELERIRILRNRICHYERIIGKSDLNISEIHASMIEMIGSMSLEAKSIIESIDCYDEECLSKC